MQHEALRGLDCLWPNCLQIDSVVCAAADLQRRIFLENRGGETADVTVFLDGTKSALQSKIKDQRICIVNFAQWPDILGIQQPSTDPWAEPDEDIDRWQWIIASIHEP